MQVAIFLSGPTRTLISIGHYLQLEPSQRPVALRCAGTDPDGRNCQALAYPKALDSKAKAPHFAATGHIPGCDEARPHPPNDDLAHAPAPKRVEHPITTITLTTDLPPATSPDEALRPARSPRPTPRSRPRRSQLRAALRVLLGNGYPPGYLIAWRSNDPVSAERFFVHLDAVTGPDARLRGYWGQVDQAIRYGPTGAIHLQPPTGPRVVLPRDQATHLGFTEPATLATLPGQHILAIGTVRKSRTGHLYILVTSHDALSHAASPLTRTTRPHQRCPCG